MNLRRKVQLSAWCALAFLLTLPAVTSAFEISIDVAPYVLNIQSEGQVVTVHTNIGYGEVDAHTVYLNGVSIASWKADNRGNFVAKFEMEEIKALPLDLNDYNTLTLDGITVNNEPFWGTKEILVINVIPAPQQE